MHCLPLSTELYHHQVGKDLVAYAAHAGRKTLEEEDVIVLLKRYCSVVVLQSNTYDICMYDSMFLVDNNNNFGAIR